MRYKEAGLPHIRTLSRVHSFTPNHTHTSKQCSVRNANSNQTQIRTKSNQPTIHSLNPHLNTTPTTHQPHPRPALIMRVPTHLLLITLFAPLSLTAPLPQPHLQLRQTTAGTTLPTAEGTTMGSTTSETGSILEEGLNLATTLAPEIIDLVKGFTRRVRV